MNFTSAVAIDCLYLYARLPASPAWQRDCLGNVVLLRGIVIVDEMLNEMDADDECNVTMRGRVPVNCLCWLLDPCDLQRKYETP